jgi:hypothetical protein
MQKRGVRHVTFHLDGARPEPTLLKTSYLIVYSDAPAPSNNFQSTVQNLTKASGQQAADTRIGA